MYCRTATGDIYLILKEEGDDYIVEGYNGHKYFKDKKTIVKVAKNIEKLFDAFVCKNQIIDKKDFDEFAGEEIYGSTWWNNELHTVAILTEDGWELE